MVSRKTTTIHDHGSGPHVHPVTPAEGPPSRKEKLIIRMERYIQHNLEHAEMLERMAAEAERWSGLETARLIRTAEDNIVLQNKPLGKAAFLLKNAGNRDLGKRLPSVPEAPQGRALHREGAMRKNKKVLTPHGFLLIYDDSKILNLLC